MQTGNEDDAAILAMAEAVATRLAQCCRARLGAVPDAAGWLRAGQALHAAGEAEAALAIFEREVRAQPLRADIWMAVATLRSELGLPRGALAASRCALACAPELAAAHANLALAEQAVGRGDAAQAAAAAALARAPTAAIRLALARMVASAQQLDQAAAAFAAIPADAPEYPAAVCGLADVDIARGRFAAAEARLTPQLAQTPTAALRITLALAYVGLGDDARAVALLAAAQRDDPAACAAWRPFFAVDRALGRARLDARHFRLVLDMNALYRCDWRRHAAFVRWLQELFDTQTPFADDDLPFALQALPLSPAARLRQARAVAGRLQQAHGGRRWPPRSAGDGRLRIGYLSGDLREHPVGRLAGCLFGLHDRSAFAVHVYHSGPQEACTARQRAEAGAEVFRDVAHLDDAAVAALVAADGIDLLIDLSGYTRHHRAAVLAMRPAPVNVAYLGYLGSSGGLADYAILDRMALTPAGRAGWSEAIAMLPDTFFLCDDRAPASTPAGDRERYGLPAGACVFASFNAVWKNEPATFAAWLRILARVPDSVLWLYDGDSAAVRENLRAAAVAGGIAGERLHFAGALPWREHLARYACVDLVLDTFVYNGNTTTVEALAQGVPVLTLAGDEVAARTAASLLAAHGLPELVTEDVAAYEAVACRLALDRQELLALHQRAARREGSRLFCSEQRVRELEAALRTMWVRHRAGLAPADFTVPRGGVA